MGDMMMAGTARTKTLLYRVWSLDVWGHGPEEHEENDCDGECDGYQVNNRCEVGCLEVTVTEQRFNVGTAHEFGSFEPDDTVLVEALIEAGYLNDSARGLCTVDGQDGSYFIEAEDGRPLLQLETPWEG